MTKLRLLDAVSRPWGQVNEDLFDCNPQAAWLFDGASSVTPRVLQHAQTDPYWLVNTLNDAIKRNWDQLSPTTAILQASTRETILRFQQLIDGRIVPLSDRPTACLLMVRLTDDLLEASTVGDCRLLHRTYSGVTAFGVELGAAAEQIRLKLNRLTAAGAMATDVPALLAPLERTIRSFVNTDDGYPIVDLTVRWIDKMTREIMPARPGDALLLLSDGFYRLVDVFGAYNHATLFEAAQRHGLLPLYDELRWYEQNDDMCASFPRVKARDDATAALVEITD